MSRSKKHLRMMIIMFSSMILLWKGADAKEEKQLEIIEYMVLSDQVLIYNDDQIPESSVSTDQLPTPPVRVLETARNGRLLKIADNMWIRSTSVKTNEQAEVRPSIEILDQGIGVDPSHTTPGTRGLGTE